MHIPQLQKYTEGLFTDRYSDELTIDNYRYVYKQLREPSESVFRGSTRGPLARPFHLAWSLDSPLAIICVQEGWIISLVCVQPHSITLSIGHTITSVYISYIVWLGWLFFWCTSSLVLGMKIILVYIFIVVLVDQLIKQVYKYPSGIYQLHIDSVIL